MKSILYLGCPSSERAETESVLGAAGVSVVWADTMASALAELKRRDMPVLLDLTPGAAALQTALDLRQQRPNTLAFAVVDDRRPDLTTEAVLSGVADVFARPLGGRRVINAIERELAYEARQPARPSTREDLYHQSPSMRELVALIARASGMRAGVLIRGEDGTGRQVVARTIHAAQHGKPESFVTCDCAASDADDLDLALFGVSAPRATGDGPLRGLERVAKRGALYSALGGTLYLQNVADAPTRIQARLARLLRDREAILADSGSPINFDVRPMASVDGGFDAAVHEGRVREDLVRRLSVIRLEMPPLRNRREDIPALANFFLREICGSQRLPPKTLSRPALSLIAALPWRGNAAELRVLLESIVSGISGGRGIGLEDVLAHVRLDGGSMVFANSGTLRQARARWEREYIGAILEQHHGRMADAARALGIQRTNLYRKIRTLRVSRKQR